MHQLAFRIAGIVVRAERHNAGIEDAAGITVSLVPSGVFIMVCNNKIVINKCILDVNYTNTTRFTGRVFSIVVNYMEIKYYY